MKTAQSSGHRQDDRQYRQARSSDHSKKKWRVWIDCRGTSPRSRAAPRPGLTPEGASTTAISPARQQAWEVPRGEEEKDGGATSPASEPAAKHRNGREVRMHTGKALARPNGFPRPAGAFPLRIVGGTAHSPSR